MNKKTFFVILVSIGMVGVLYSLPKGVVVNETKEATAERMGEKADSAAVAASSEGAGQHTVMKLTPEQLEEIDKLKEGLKSGPKAEVFIAISDAFFRFQRFDSSAVYAEKAADLEPSVVNLIRAGDRYYEAFSFAMNGEKANALAAQTRKYYQKALDLNPNYTYAKANMAMTYVNSDNPMQAINMLRGILDEDPTNEMALFNLGVLSMKSNQYNRAVQRFSQIVANNPNNTKAKFFLAVSLIETGKKEEAGKLLKEVKQVEQDPAIQNAIAELEERL